ncbi:MAG TPA: hypothetical protein VF751_11995 [Chthoniobacterales bacterium]
MAPIAFNLDACFALGMAVFLRRVERCFVFFEAGMVGFSVNGIRIRSQLSLASQGEVFSTAGNKPLREQNYVATKIQ